MRAVLVVTEAFFLLICFLQTTNFVESSGPTNAGQQPARGIIRKLLSRLRKSKNSDMGQAVRMMKYDRAGNLANALPALEFQGNQLSWHRLDDGVMGGKSETVHENENGLHFCGTINTNGGGFASIRAPILGGLANNTEAIRLRFRGDGKTYKLLLSNGNASPFSGSPSWQADIPTEKRNEGEEMQQMTIPLKDLSPSFGGRAASRPSKDEMSKYNFDPVEMSQLGLMLSLKLSDGSPNPKETFGEGIFPFSLLVESIEPVMAKE